MNTLGKIASTTILLAVSTSAVLANGTTIRVDYQAVQGEISKGLSGLMADPLGHGYEFVTPDNVLGTKYVRIGWGGDIGFYLNPWPAEGVYDWENLDHFLDKLSGKGYNILFPFAFTPKWLWPDRPDVNDYFPERWFKYYKKGYTLPPTFLEKYEELVYQTVKHLLIDKGYNIEFEGLNEPNIPMFWNGTMKEAFQLYEVIARAVKRVSPDAVIGGPAIANYNQKWIGGFIDYVVEHKVPVDFVSWHHYGPPKPYGLDVQTAKVRKIIDAHPSLGTPQLYLTESSYDWRPDSLTVESPFHAAYMANSLNDMVRCGLDRFYYCGESGTLEALNPASQTLAMFNKLAPTRIQTTLKNEGDGTGVIATRHEEGVDLLIWNLPEVNEKLPIKQNKVTLYVENLPQGTYHYTRYLVDSQHMPGPMQKVERKSLLMNVPENMIFNSGQVVKPPITFDLETYGVTLVQLEIDIKHSDDIDFGWRRNEK